MSSRNAEPTEAMECPLCLGEGELQRVEVLERLGMRDFARVAQLSAEEAFRLLSKSHQNGEQAGWARFESELAKRTAELGRKHDQELQTLRARLAAKDQFQNVELQRLQLESDTKIRAEQAAKDDLNRRVQDAFREVNELRHRNQALEVEMSKVARIGKREELDFAQEAQTWPGVAVSEKLPRNGDYILCFRDPSGAALEPRLFVDNKDKATVSEGDIDKLVRDAKERAVPVAVLVAREESQLRQSDRGNRWSCTDNVWVLRTTRSWFPRDLEVLKPLFDKMRVQGTDFLQRNASLA